MRRHAICRYLHDYDATQAVLELDDEAKRRGVTILTMGWTPGITNLRQKRGSVAGCCENVHISWVGSAAGAEGLAVILHTMIFYRRCPRFDGKPLDIKAATVAVRSVLRSLGDVAVYHVVI